MDPNMKPNNTTPSAQPEKDRTSVSTDKGATPQSLPGISGRKVAWGLGIFMAFSLIAIPLGLFVYQGVSDQEKRIQRDWPSVAAQLDSSYSVLDGYLETASSNGDVNQTLELWKKGRQTFRSKRVWFEQLQAAQTLEDLLQSPASPSNSLRLVDLINAPDLREADQQKIAEVRTKALDTYRDFEAEQLTPYKTALTNFPGNTVLLFFKLPEPPPFRATELKVAN
jgi:hypothetical protein